MCHLALVRQTDQWNRTESPQIDVYLHEIGHVEKLSEERTISH